MVTTPTDLFRTRHMKGVTLTNDEGDALVGNPSYSQASHGFSVGSVVYRDSATTYAKARSDSPSTIKHGLSLVVWVSGSQYSLLRFSNHQVVNVPSHGLGSFGTEVGVSDTTAGALAALTAIPVGRRVYLGFVIDDDHIQWEPFARVEDMDDVLTLRPRSEPADPGADGEIIGWLSDGTEAYYDAGDIIFKVRQGGVTKSFRIIAYEAV